MSRRLPRRRLRRGDLGAIRGRGVVSTVRASAARLAARGRGRGRTTRGLAALMQIGAHISSAAGSTRRSTARSTLGRRFGAGLHAEPARVAADEPRPGELRALPREARRRRGSAASSAMRSTSKPRDARSPCYERSVAAMRNTTEVAVRDRRRRRRLPRRLASRQRLRGGARACRARARAGARALHRRDVAADGELRRRRRHDRALDRGAGDDLRADRDGTRGSASASTRATSGCREST